MSGPNLRLNLMGGSGSGLSGSLQTYMQLGMNTNFLSMYDTPRFFANMVKQAGVWEQRLGTGGFTQHYGNLVPDVATDEFNLTISNSSTVLMPEGEYTFRNMTGGEIKGGPNAGGNAFFDWTAATSGTFTIGPGETGLNIGSRGATGMTDVQIIRTSNLASHDAGNPWDLDYLAYLQSLSPKTLRMMNLNHTNTNVVTTWAERCTPSDITFQTGVPVEVQVDLANRLNIDPWFCIGVRWDDAHILNFATYVKANLNSNLKPYWEWSNEAWNSGAGFAEQTAWVKFYNAIGDNSFKCDPATDYFSKRDASPHGLSNGDLLACFLDIEQVTSGFEFDPYWKLARGVTNTVQVIDAYNFTLYNGAELLDVKPSHTKIVVKNVTGLDDTLLDTHFGQGTEHIAGIVDTQFARNERYTVLATQSGNTSRITARYDAVVNKSLLDYTAIATYYKAAMWSTKLDVISGGCTPKLWLNTSGHKVYFSVYDATATPTFKEAMNGIGAIAFEDITYANGKNSYEDSTGTPVTGLVDDTAYVGEFTLVDEWGFRTRISVPFTPTVAAQASIITHDTPENQAAREVNAILYITQRVKTHQDLAPLPVIGYEGGQDYAAAKPTEVESWQNNIFYLSTAIESSMTLYQNSLARFGPELWNHYKDTSKSPFSLTYDIYNAILDGRFRAYADFGGQVAIPDSYLTMTSTSPAILTPPVGANDVFFNFASTLTKVTTSGTPTPISGVVWEIASGNEDGKWYLNPTNGDLSLAVGKTHDWNNHVIEPLTIKATMGSVVTQGLHQVTLGNAVFVDIVAEGTISNGGVPDYHPTIADRYTFTTNNTIAYPAVSLLSWVPDIADGGVIHIGFEAQCGTNDDNKPLEVQLKGTVNGSVITLADEPVLANTPNQSYALDYTNSSGFTATSVYLRFRYNNVTVPSTDLADSEIGNLFYLIS